MEKQIYNVVEKIINEFISNITLKYKYVEKEALNELKEKIILNEMITEQKLNKGTGAGGANTNYYGKTFEEKTSNENRLIILGYEKNYLDNKKCGFYLSKTFEDKTITFTSQSGLKKYLKNKYNIDIFRWPDEAYIIEYKTGEKIIKILEKKHQNIEGSVIDKLWGCIALKREWDIILNETSGYNFKIYYAYCLSDFLKKKISSMDKKYCTLRKILEENQIEILFGDDKNYFELLDMWINNF